MESPRVHFIRIAGEVRGPVGIEQLRDLGSVEVITPESLVAPSAAGPWTPIAALPICAEVFPPRRVIGFKAKEFEEINRGAAAAMNPEEAILQANQPPSSFRGREVLVTPPGRRGTRDGEPPNEVQAMVLEVGRQIAAHAPPPAPPPRRPRFPRWRWLVFPSVFGTAGIMAIPLLYDRQYDSSSLSILIGWTGLFNLLLVGILALDRSLGDKVSAGIRQAERGNERAAHPLRNDGEA